MCDVTIIIPNYNGADDLAACLDALAKQTYAADVIVVDDGSEEELTAVPGITGGDGPEEDPSTTLGMTGGDGGMTSGDGGMTSGDGGIRSLTVIRHAENRGFAAAVNTGIRAAKTPYVILLNNDTVAEPAFTERLLRAIKRRKRAFAVQAMMLQCGEDSSYKTDCVKDRTRCRDRGVVDSSGDYFCALGWAFSPGRDKPASRYMRPARIMSACAGAAIYDRAALEALGLFDEAHFCYLEDVDLSLRAYRAGLRIYYEPEAKVYHKASATSGSRYNAFKARMTTANSLYTVYKNLPVWMITLFSPLLLAGFVIKGVFYARKGLGGAFAQGLREGVKKIAAYRRGGEVLRVDTSARRDAMLAMELLGNCVRRVAG